MVKGFKVYTLRHHESKNHVMAEKKARISDLKKDNRNANKGTDLGDSLLRYSFSQYGAGRSILIDKNGTVIGGNHALDKAAEAGIDEVIIVQTDGRQLVAVQRTDIDLNSKEGRELALADNRTAQANINLDLGVIRELDAEFDLDLGGLGISLADGGPTFSDDYNDEDAAEAMETGGHGGGGGYSENLFPLAVALNKAEHHEWEAFKKFHKLKNDTDAFKVIFKHAMQSL